MASPAVHTIPTVPLPSLPIVTSASHTGWRHTARTARETRSKASTVGLIEAWSSHHHPDRDVFITISKNQAAHAPSGSPGMSTPESQCWARTRLSAAAAPTRPPGHTRGPWGRGRAGRSWSRGCGLRGVVWCGVGQHVGCHATAGTCMSICSGPSGPDTILQSSGACEDLNHVGGTVQPTCAQLTGPVPKQL